MKFLCVCGATIHTSGAIPNPQEWLYISDTSFDGFTGQVDSEEVYGAMNHAFRCPTSGHLWVFDRGIGEDPSGYAPIGRLGDTSVEKGGLPASM